MFEKVVAAHGEERPELASLRDMFGALAQELSAHMMKEENVLFPYQEKMEEAVSRGAAPPPAHPENNILFPLALRMERGFAELAHVRNGVA